jgi:hypothetical protein
MRLKITHALSGSIDGIQLSQFVVGRSYDASGDLGAFLLAVGAAEPTPEEEVEREPGPPIGACLAFPLGRGPEGGLRR